MDIFSLLRIARSKAASDVHLVTSSSPLIRVNGSLEPVNGVGNGSLEPANGIAPLTAEDISEAFFQITTPEEREHFHRHLELDFGYTLPEVGRLRCNAAQQRGSISLALRLLPPVIPTIENLLFS